MGEKRFALNRATILVVKGDITKQDVDAVVNASNPELGPGSGVNGAIRKAGGNAIARKCEEIRKHRGPLEGGEALHTTAGNMPADYVIHVAGPVYQDGNQGEEKHLRDCYANALKLAADKLDAKSIAFPALSCGVYGYPVDEGLTVALEEMKKFAESGAPDGFEMRLVLFGDGDFSQASDIGEKVLG